MKRTAQMLIDSGFTDIQTIGNLPEGDAITEMLHDDVATNGWF
jgi:hypothetical protein